MCPKLVLFSPREKTQQLNTYYTFIMCAGIMSNFYMGKFRIYLGLVGRIALQNLIRRISNFVKS